MTSLESKYEEVFESLFSELSEVNGVERFTKTIDGIDGNKIKLYIHKPENKNLIFLEFFIYMVAV